jgi:hypothetical protein
VRISGMSAVNHSAKLRGPRRRSFVGDSAQAFEIDCDDILRKAHSRGPFLLVPIPAGWFKPDCGFSITVDKNNDVDEFNELNNSGTGSCLG